MPSGGEKKGDEGEHTQASFGPAVGCEGGAGPDEREEEG